MKKQSGFTLIELVIVIIILGILAVTAAPKFLNLQDDARTSTLKGVEGSLNSAGAMVYSKAVIAGKDTTASDTLDIGNGVDVGIAFGYPKATKDDLEKVLQLSTNDWSFGTPASSSIKIFPAGVSASTATDCYVTYTQAITSGSQPTAAVTACK
ncbi:prepilin-type N-terminal cleavage/methylation domain-containing protein [Aeromonas caviae]|uniref:Prepilin-type N-terminal cleavage/methylation domain-containing protein n=1 Tax=Aeromonas caviae TaxID=648 RepID=A0ABU5W9J2_AERCA|nr:MULTISPECIES: prepilin-type N-terminal cleavage/methylation domain-containing protein [Aeromonas]MCR3893922.1 prepilin-type N-terminal cleavage/methylation domain-containing protein [Aeromonas caviae]MEA9436118.1 prepilin-type N-terminal cleavage/methylation domain-containing protein [Aeromonas caviae]